MPCWELIDMAGPRGLPGEIWKQQEQDGKQSGGHADQAREQDERVGRPEPVPELSLQVVKATEDSRFLLRLACHGFFLRHPSRMRTPQTRMSSTCSSSASLRQASIRCRSSSS